jgi:hypothetical protein
MSSTGGEQALFYRAVGLETVERARPEVEWFHESGIG